MKNCSILHGRVFVMILGFRPEETKWHVGLQLYIYNPIYEIKNFDIESRYPQKKFCTLGFKGESCLGKE